jgi:hypothetical protein
MTEYEPREPPSFRRTILTLVGAAVVVVIIFAIVFLTL